MTSFSTRHSKLNTCVLLQYYFEKHVKFLLKINLLVLLLVIVELKSIAHMATLLQSEPDATTTTERNLDTCDSQEHHQIYHRELCISSLLVSEYSFHIGYKWVLAKGNTTHGNI